MFKLLIPIFYRTEAMENAPDDVYFKFTDYDIKNMIFYDISALGTYKEDGIEYTIIHTPGGAFYSSKKISEIDKMITEAHSKKFLLS